MSANPKDRPGTTTPGTQPKNPSQEQGRSEMNKQDKPQANPGQQPGNQIGQRHQDQPGSQPQKQQGDQPTQSSDRYKNPDDAGGTEWKSPDQETETGGTGAPPSPGAKNMHDQGNGASGETSER